MAGQIHAVQARELSHADPYPTSRMPDTRRRLRLELMGSARRARSCHSSRRRSSASASAFSSGVMTWRGGGWAQSSS